MGIRDSHRPMAEMEPKEFVIYTDMVGDLFHCGHMNFLRQCREVATAEECGDRKIVLVVGVHSDELVMTYKRQPVLTMDERAASVGGCKYVDRVVDNAPMGLDEEYLALHKIDLIAGGAGDGFNSNDSEHEASCTCVGCLHDRQYDLVKAKGIFRGIPYTPGISTTDILQRINDRREEYFPEAPKKVH
eukprot:TRINITY_DN18964_c0_g1_i3.p1 TRINITY_DN18964_c0_g1~~TRINITY_DN18964_c0_g1_i3.p1  ORF type:complete len:204 (-),score=35.55 TRINITY_DN18964_c0_g1_i3:70-633(-)